MNLPEAPARTNWKWKLARHVAAYTVLGTLATALTGAICGALVGAGMGWDPSVPMRYIRLWDYAIVGGFVGVLCGGAPGAIIFFLAGFRPPRGFWRSLGRDLRLVLLAMTAGALGSALTLALIGTVAGSLGTRFYWSEYAIWGCPLMMMCGEILGAVLGRNKPRKP